MCTKFWSENLKGRDHSEDLGIDVKMIRMDLREVIWEIVTGCIWLKILVSDRLL
jgi:hypothetical protein